MTDEQYSDDIDVEILRDRITKGEYLNWFELRELAVELKDVELRAECDVRIEEVFATILPKPEHLDQFIDLTLIAMQYPQAIPSDWQATGSVLTELWSALSESGPAPLESKLSGYLHRMKDRDTALEQANDDLADPGLVTAEDLVGSGGDLWAHFLASEGLANHLTKDGVTLSDKAVKADVMDGFMWDQFGLTPRW